jgi:hypothetical protein
MWQRKKVMTKIFGNGKICSDQKRWQWKKVMIESLAMEKYVATKKIMIENLAMEKFVAIEKGSNRKWS